MKIIKHFKLINNKNIIYLNLGNIHGLCINWDISDFNLGMWYRCMVPMIRKFLESSGYYFHILFPITAFRGFVEKAVIESEDQEHLVI